MVFAWRSETGARSKLFPICAHSRSDCDDPVTKLELPGEQEQLVDTRLREADDRGEEEYKRRTEGVGAEQAAAIAVEISRDRREEENHPPETVGTTIESGNANGQESSTTPNDR